MYWPLAECDRRLGIYQNLHSLAVRTHIVRWNMMSAEVCMFEAGKFLYKQRRFRVIKWLDNADVRTQDGSSVSLPPELRQRVFDLIYERRTRVGG